MANWANPVGTTAYSQVLSNLRDRDIDNARQFDSSEAAASSIPLKAKRWNETNKNWEKWNGTSWGALASSYGISITGNAGNVSGVVAIANGGTGASNQAGIEANLAFLTNGGTY